MTKPAHKRHETNEERRRTRRHIRNYRRHKNNPCPHRPRTLELGEIHGKYIHHPHKRHHRWKLHLWWQEVNVDSDGFPIIVRSYKVKVEYTANGVDWFMHARHTIPAKFDFDKNELVHASIPHINPRLAYRFIVEAVGRDCVAEPSEWRNLGSALDVPPAPHDVRILRASHGIRIRWRAPRHLPRYYARDRVNTEGTLIQGVYAQDGDTPYSYDDFVKEFGPADDHFFHKAISHFEVELWVNKFFGPREDFTADASTNKFTSDDHGLNNGDVIGFRNHHDINDDTADDDFPDGIRHYKMYIVANATTNTFKVVRDEDSDPVDIETDGSGTILVGFARHAAHVHHHMHRFRIDADEFDEDLHFYGRVRSVAEHHGRSAWIPATAGGNDDPEAEPTGRRPAWHRRTFTFDPLGPLVEGAISARTLRLDDDYIVRRVTGSTGEGSMTAQGGSTNIDILVKRHTGGSYTSMFDADVSKMLQFNPNDDDASTNDMAIKLLERGDKLRTRIAKITGDPPDYRAASWSVIADRRKGDSEAGSGTPSDPEINDPPVTPGPPASPDGVVRGLFSASANYTDPIIAATTVQAQWDDLQPSSGGAIVQPNAIDQRLADSSLPVRVRLYLGRYAPSWAKNIGGTPIDYTDPYDGQTATVGRWWHPDYIAAAQDFYDKLAAIYDGNADIVCVFAAAAMTVYAEPCIRGINSATTRQNLLDAGYTKAADQDAEMAQIDMMTTWTQTPIGLAYNPWQYVNANGSSGSDPSFTADMMDHHRDLFGAYAILQNNSIRESYISSPPGWYSIFTARGGPKQFQTAAATRVGDVYRTCDWAIDYLGASGIELHSPPDSVMSDAHQTEISERLQANT